MIGQLTIREQQSALLLLIARPAQLPGPRSQPAREEEQVKAVAGPRNQ